MSTDVNTILVADKIKHFGADWSNARHEKHHRHFENLICFYNELHY